MSWSASKLNLGAEAAELDSDFEGDQQHQDDNELVERRRKRAKRKDLADKGHTHAHAHTGQAGPSTSSSSKRPSRREFGEEAAADEGRRGNFHRKSLSAYDRHKELVNEYMLYYRGATGQLQRDKSKDRTDLDVIRDNNRFLWDEQGGKDDKEGDDKLTWGQRMAKKYWQKLFKEYCICDLSRYKDNKVAMRWRTEAEVATGKGQFQCGARKCEEREGLRSWEVNFAYQEEGQSKNALVKVRLCPDCSYKLNYHHRKKEVTKKTKKSKEKRKRRRRESSSSSSTDEETRDKVSRMRERKKEEKQDKMAADIWSKPVEVEVERSREEDFSEYLEDLFM